MNEENSSNDSNASQPVEILTTIFRSIPVGYGGYIIGKKGIFKAKLMEEYGAFLVLHNDPNDCTKQIITLSCPEDQRKIVEQKIDYKLSQLKTITIKTVTSRPSMLRPSVRLGKLVAGYVMNSGESEDVIVILDPPSDMSKSFVEMHKEMQADYSNKSVNGGKAPPHLPRPISAGCMCVAQGANKNQFYRAVVVSVFQGNGVDGMGGYGILYLLDIGKFECLPFDRIFKIRVKYMSAVFNAIPAKWNNAEIACDTFPGAPTIIKQKFLMQPTNSEQKPGSPILLPRRVYLYFTHVDCCVPHVSIYVPRSLDSLPSAKEASDSDFVDLLEVLCNTGLARRVRSCVQISQSGNNGTPFFHEQPNYASFYEAFTEISLVEEQDECDEEGYEEEMSLGKRYTRSKQCKIGPNARKR